MLRRLILLRHAKSAWNTGHVDHARPLNGRGRRDAPRMGALLTERGYVPDLVVSSDAQRTQETWEGLQESLPGIPVRWNSLLYLGGGQAIGDTIANQPSEIRCLLLIGHNPGFSAMASWLSGEDIELKTATAAVMEIDADEWADAMGQGDWNLIEVFRPPQDD
jgi:phosphohistidine phosphatase